MASIFLEHTGCDSEVLFPVSSEEPLKFPFDKGYGGLLQCSYSQFEKEL